MQEKKNIFITPAILGTIFFCALPVIMAALEIESIEVNTPIILGSFCFGYVIYQKMQGFKTLKRILLTILFTLGFGVFVWKLILLLLLISLFF